MSSSKYSPGPAHGAGIDKNGEEWILTLVRELRHPPALVWEALTDPAQLEQWAPFNASGHLATSKTVQLSTVGTPAPLVSETTIRRAEKPTLLEYNWGDQTLKWQLEAIPGGTRLKLWHRIDRRFIAMGAAGWHICLDVLEYLLAGTPLGRIVGPDAMNFGWPELNRQYASMFGVEPISWSPSKK